MSPGLTSGFGSLLFVSATLLVCFACGSEERVVLASSPLNLFDNLDSASFDGLARRLVEDPPAEAENVLISADFENESLGGLTPFGGHGVEAENLSSRIEIVRDRRADERGRFVRLSGPAAHGVSLRTKPMKVAPGTTYEISYQVSCRGVKHQPEAKSGTVSVVLYKLPVSVQDRAQDLISDPEREKEARLHRPPRSLWLPPCRGTQPWRRIGDSFWIEREATHMVVSFDLSRSRDDRKPHEASGVIEYDDISLTEMQGSVHQRYTSLDEGVASAHPLKMALELPGASHPQATESRYAIYAPAPSTISYSVAVPKNGILSLAYALTPEALERFSGGDLAFEVSADTPDGQSHSLYRKNLETGQARHWFDADIDLSHFAGTTIALHLITRGRPPPESGSEALGRFPEAGMVWGEPILHSADDPGRTIVLIGLDTVAARHTSLYGYPRATTPNLEAIAKQGATFRRAGSPSPWTLPPFASLLTGLDPVQHLAGQITPNVRQWRSPLDSRFRTVAEHLRAAGWETHAWVNNIFLTKDFGLDQGFSHFVDYGTRSFTEEASEAAVKEVVDVLSRPAGYDRFLFVHFMDAHTPYLPNEEFRKRFVSVFPDGRIRGKEGTPWRPRSSADI